MKLAPEQYYLSTLDSESSALPLDHGGPLFKSINKSVPEYFILLAKNKLQVKQKNTFQKNSPLVSKCQR